MVNERWTRCTISAKKLMNVGVQFAVALLKLRTARHALQCQHVGMEHHSITQCRMSQNIGVDEIRGQKKAKTYHKSMYAGQSAVACGGTLAQGNRGHRAEEGTELHEEAERVLVNSGREHGHDHRGRPEV